MKAIRLAILLFITYTSAYSQAWVWEKPINTTSNSIATDPNSNVIVLGQNGTSTQLSKFTKDGALIWTNRYTKKGTFTPSGSVAVDKNGNIFTYTEGFDSINSQFTGVKLRGVTKFNPQGTVLWHVAFYTGTLMPDRVLPIQLDDNDNVYVCYFQNIGPPVVVHLGNLTTVVNNANPDHMALGSISPDGTPRWVRGFAFRQSPSSGLGDVTGFSVAGNKIFVAGNMTKYRLLLDNGLVLTVDRCSAWLAAFDGSNGQSLWGKSHDLFYYCLGLNCGCSKPSLKASSLSGRVTLTNNLNGAFEFQPLDTIASISAFGQTPVKSYYTIYDTIGNPVKGKIIEDVPSLFTPSETISGARGKFLFIQARDTLRKVDTGFSLIWKVTLPPAATAATTVFIPKNTNDIIATYTRASVTYLAKMVDSAGVISGRVYADWNNDSVFTSADSALSNILITTGSSQVNSISSNDNGKYYMYAAPAPYTLSAHFNHPYYQFLPVAHTATISQLSDSISGKDFRLRPLFNFTDVSVNYTALNIARPGHVTSYSVTAKNFGPISAPVTIGLKLPNLTSYNNVTGGSVIVNTPDSITISIGNVSPFETKKVILDLNIGTTATISDTLRFFPKAYPYVIDTIKTNNTDTLIQPVRTSFDPNEKEINTQKRLLGDTSKAMVYTIHFQNTGTDTAFYVRIADTVSSKHDIRSFSFIGASHNLSTDISNNVINFILNPIELPDSNHNEKQSHGFVKFSIKPLAPFSITDTLYNKAAIYFDFNNPVLTNNVKSWYYKDPSPPPIVVLLSFTAEKPATAVNLKFITASEPGLAQFVIERSTDSINFSTLGSLNATGTATTGSSYQFTDNTPDPVVNFYRLKLLYTDGRIAYSAVVVVRTPLPLPGTATEIIVFPSPAKDILYISLKNIPDPKIVNCRISDATGKIVWSGSINAGTPITYPLKTAFWSSGIYFINISNDNLIFRKKIVIIP